MAEQVLLLFDDVVARDFQPVTLTRPAGELLFGACLQRVRAQRVFGRPCRGHLAAPHLADFDEPGAPPVLADAGALTAEASIIYVSSRAVPAWNATLPATLPALLTIGGEPVGWAAARGALPPDGFLDDPTAHAPGDVAPHELGGRILRHVWELVSLAESQLATDIAALAAGSAPLDAPGVHVLGDGPVVLGRDVRLEPQVVLDTRRGPIWLDRGVSVLPFTYVCGPVYVGPGGTLLGEEIEGSAFGPVCRVHGQVEASVMLGYSNKAHTGFLGHAYLGRWVNLGAMTTNSDLKNNYRPVDVWTPAGPMPSGETKMGCFLGDHVKTGIGTLLNTGTVIGAGSNLWGAVLPPKHVPPFSWGSGDDLVPYEPEKFIENAAAAMARRDMSLSDRARRQLRAAWQAGRQA